MTTTSMPATNEPAPREVPPPSLVDGRLICPRCSARVLSSGSDLFCAACGYEYGLRRFFEQGGRLPGMASADGDAEEKPARRTRSRKAASSARR